MPYEDSEYFGKNYCTVVVNRKLKVLEIVRVIGILHGFAYHRLKHNPVTILNSQKFLCWVATHTKHTMHSQYIIFQSNKSNSKNTRNKSAQRYFTICLSTNQNYDELFFEKGDYFSPGLRKLVQSMYGVRKKSMNRVVSCSRSSYYPELAPGNYFLFPNIQSFIKKLRT